MKNYNSSCKYLKKDEYKSKIRIINALKVLSTISISVLVFLLALSVVLKPALDPIKPEEKKPVTYNLTDTIQEQYLRFAPGANSDEAIFVGFQNVTPSNYDSFISGKTLKIPDTIVLSGSLRKVVGIDIVLGIYDPQNGYAFTAGEYPAGGSNGGMYDTTEIAPILDGQAYSSSNIGVKAIIVPGSVQYISRAAFYGAKDLEYYEAPFIGLSREVTADEDLKGYRAFASIFGYYEYIEGRIVKPDNTYANPGTAYRAGSFTIAYGNQMFGMDLVYDPWYYRQTDVGYSNNKEFSTLYKFYSPVNLDKIVITDEGLATDKQLEAVNRAFWQIPNVREIVLPNKMLTFGDAVFYANLSLETVVLPDNIAVYKERLFGACPVLETVHTNKTLSEGKPDGVVYLPQNIHEINNGTFYACRKIKEVVIPNGITRIGNNAFDSCDALSLVYPVAPEQQVGLLEKEIRLNEALQHIGNDAFTQNKANKIYVPAGVQTIGERAFNASSQLEQIVLPFIGNARQDATNKNTKKRLFGYIFGGTGGGANNVVQQAKNGGDAQTEGYYNISESLTSITILDDNAIGDGAFMNLFMVTSITIVENAGATSGISSISEGSFRGCIKLESLTVPFIGNTNSATGRAGKLGWIFGSTATGAGNEELEVNQGTDIKFFPKSFKNITITNQGALRSGSFYNCSNIERVVVSKATTWADANVFHGVTKLNYLELPFVGSKRGHTTDHFYGVTNNYVNSMVYIFSNVETAATYRVDIYDHWGYTAFVPEGLETLVITNDNYLHWTAMYHFRSLKTLVIEDSTTYISHSAFRGLGGLKTLNVPFIGRDKNPNANNGYEYTLSWMFGDGSYANSYWVTQRDDRGGYIPNGLESVQFSSAQVCIPYGAFKDCKSLKFVESNATINSLGAHAFDGCVNLSVLTLPNAQYTKVSDYAFRNCKGMIFMDEFVPKTIKTVGNGAFYGTNISSIFMYDDQGKPIVYDSIGSYAFANCLQITSVDLTPMVSKNIGTHLFSGCKYLTDVVLIPDTAKPYMFENCESLRGVDLRNITTVIPDGFFSGCKSLVWADGANPDGLILDPATTTFGAYAFKDCKSLVGDYIVPSNVSLIKTGAFQGCNALTSMTIALATVVIEPYVYRSADLKLEINPDFELFVRREEKDWPSGWVKNWNCYYPVNVLGSSYQDIFLYEYDDDNLAWRIVGINSAKVGLGDLVGTIRIPETYKGLDVIGIGWEDGEAKDNAGKVLFPDFFPLLEYVDTIILSKNLQMIAKNSFLRTDNKLLNIYSQESRYSTNDKLHIGNENYYMDMGRVYYKETWKFDNNEEPIWNTADLVIEFMNNHYEYTGDEIKPEIAGIYSQVVLLGESVKDEVAAAFKVERMGSQQADFSNYDGNNVSTTFKNNIKAGTGTMNLTVSSSKFYGTATKNFTISKKIINLFGPNATNPSEIHKTFDGKEWVFSEFVPGLNVYGLVGKDKFSATIKTNGFNVKYLPSTSIIIPYSGLLNEIVFQGAWRVYDENSKDVTSNYSVLINLKVYIQQFEVDHLEYFGYDSVINLGTVYEHYRYSYTGATIKPTVRAVNAAGDAITTGFVVTVNDPSNAIFPGTGVTLTATTSVDPAHQGNLKMPTIPPYNMVVTFEIVNAKLKIEVNVNPYVIGAQENYFSFSDFPNWKSYSTPQFNVKLTGINPTSTLNGEIRTDDWLKGTYKSSNTGSFKIDWTTLGYNITHSTLKESDAVSPLIENAFYDVTLEATVSIIYRTIKYELLIDGSPIVVGEKGVISYNKTTNKIVYGADGYTHYLSIKTTDPDAPANVIFSPGLTPTVSFRDIKEYEFSYDISYPRYETISNEKVILEVVKGSYKFGGLTKEYDKKAVDPLDTLLRTPIDLDYSKIEFTFYKKNGANLSQLTQPPYDIGNYLLVINTLPGHSEWFNDVVDYKIDFSITQRTLYIYVSDDISPFDSKEYDGLIWSKSYVNSTDPLHNLLAGDKFTGNVMTYSSEIGVYETQNHFVINNGWKVYDSDGIDVTKVYKIFFVGPYSITPRIIDASITGVNKVYDGHYSSIDVQVYKPTDGSYTIWYSTTQITEETETTAGGDWTQFPISFYQPGVYTVYVKITAPNHKPFYGAADIVIDALQIDCVAINQTVAFDGYAHTPSFIVYSPWSYDVSFAYINPEDFGNVSYDELSFSPVCKAFIDVGIYNYVIKFEALNYQTVYKNVYLEITDSGGYISANINGFAGQYDGFPHSATVTVTNPTSYSVYYYVGKVYNYTEDTGIMWQGVNPEFIDAGKYYVTVKIMAKGYAPLYTVVLVDIEFLNMTITANDYQGFYDGEYHGADLNNVDIPNLLYNGTVDVVIYYNDVNITLLASSWTTTPIKYKDVGIYKIYMYVTAPNYNPCFVEQEIIIERSPTPVSVTEKYTEIEYLAQPIPDFEVITIHDGVRIYTYYEYLPNGQKNPIPISNPKELGKYHVEIQFLQSKNCIGTTFSCDFEIIPRKLIITFDDKLEYTGTYQMPVFKVDTQTIDVIKVSAYITDVPYVDPIDIGTYNIKLEMEVYDPNYEIEFPDQQFHIVPRKVKVDYYEQYEYDGNRWTKDDFWTVGNILVGHSFYISLTSYGSAVSTYRYLGPNNPLNRITLNSLLVEDINGNDVSHLYEFVWNVVVDICLPKLDIEALDKEVVYDANDHTIDVVIKTQGIITNPVIRYWTVEGSGPTPEVPFIYFSDAGIYEIHFTVETAGFEKFTGSVILTIKKANLLIDIDDFDETYENVDYQATYKILDPIMGSNFTKKPVVRYIKAEGLDVDDLISFASGGLSQNHKIYSKFINEASDKMHDAAKYYCLVYYEGDNNVNRSFAIEELEVKKKGIDFYFPVTSYTKSYDGKPFSFTLAGMSSYDTTDICVGHNLLTDYPNYIIQTKSKNAGVYNDSEKSFEFKQIQIVETTTSKNVAANYFPIVHNVSVEILRIPLTDLKVEDLLKVYDGKENYPKITTESDGEITVTYYRYDPVTDTYSSIPEYEVTDAGQFKAAVMVGQGTNHYAWANPPLEAIVICKPKEVEVKWTELESRYSGKGKDPKPYIVDVEGNKQYIDFKILSEETPGVPFTELVYVRNYLVEAYIEPINLAGIKPGNYTLTNNEETYNILRYQIVLDKVVKQQYQYTEWAIEIDEEFLNSINQPLPDDHIINAFRIKTKENRAGTFVDGSEYSLFYEIFLDKGGGVKEDVSACFEIINKLRVALESNGIIYEVHDYEKVYSGTDQYVDLTVHTPIDPRLYTITYKLFTQEEIDAEIQTKGEFKHEVKNYTGDNPRLRDVGIYYVYFRISIGSDTMSNIVEDYGRVEITLRDSYITFSALNKVYDGKPISASVLSNAITTERYNGVRDDLTFEIYCLNTGQTVDSAFNAGRYRVTVKSKADTNPSTVKNYTDLEQIVFFEITQAKLTLLLRSEHEVTSANPIYDYIEMRTPAANNGNDIIKVEGIVQDNAEFYVTVYALGLTRKSYIFNASGAPSGTFTVNGFTFDWSVYQSGTGNDLSGNYYLDIDVNIKVRYKLMKVVAQDYTKIHDGSPAIPSVNVITPTTGATISYSDTYGGPYNIMSNHAFPVNAGVYTIYYKCEANDYEVFMGSVKVTIEHQNRTGFKKGELTKVYDGQNAGMPTDLECDSETLNPATFTIAYYKAVYNGTKWVRTGNALTEAVEAGDYMYVVTIPANSVFGQTKYEKYFEITRRPLTISGTSSKTFDGSSWNYNLNLNKDSLVINGLLTDHYIKEGLLNTSGAARGLYTETDIARNVYLSKIVIEDFDLRDVTQNYTYELDIDVEILDGVIVVSPQVKDYIYNGYAYKPYVNVLVPGNPSEYVVQYSADNQNWQVDPCEFVYVNSYTLFVKVTAPNYSPFMDSYNFDITYATATIAIEPQSMTRQYNALPMNNPKVITNAKNDNPTITFTYYEIDNLGIAYILQDAPTNVGKYKVVVEVADTQNFTGKQEEFEFEITPCVLVPTWSDLNLTYNAQSQVPSVKFTSSAYPGWTNIDNTVIGLQFDYFYVVAGAKGSQISAANSVNVNEYCVDAIVTNPNYLYNTITQPYKINKLTITFKMSTTEAYELTKVYQYGPLSSPGFTIDGLPQSLSVSGLMQLNNPQVQKYEAISEAQFNNHFTWINPLEIKDGSTVVNSNFIMKYNVSLELKASAISYTAYDYTGVYDGMKHSIDLQVHMAIGSYTILYGTTQFDTSSSTNLGYLDAGDYVVWFKISAPGYTSVIDSRTIKISKDETSLSFLPSLNLDKVYDSVAISNPTVNYNGDTRGPLKYTYYYLDTTSVGGQQFVQVSAGQTVKDVAKYKLVVTMPETTNYKTASIEVEFEITPRTITLRATDAKTFDGYRWQATISNDVTVTDRLASATIDNLVPGHYFNGIVQTVGIDAGHYVLETDFNFYNYYTIYNSLQEAIPLQNYIVELDLDVLINLATMTAFANDIVVPYDGDPHFINVQFNPVLLVSTWTIGYTEDPFANYTPTNIMKTSAGIYTIFFKVEAPNYTTMYSSARIEIIPLDSDLLLNAPNKIYDGDFYNGLVITASSTGLQTVQYYQKDPNNNLTPVSVPKNAGNYEAWVTVAGDGTYAQKESKISFQIEKASVPVIWGSTSFDYNGQPQVPTATATHTLFDGSTYNIPLTVNGQQIKAGAYTSLNQSQAAATTNDPNYTLLNNKTNFQILKVKINTPVFNDSDQKITYGDPITLVDTNGNIYHIDENGNVTRIDYPGTGTSDLDPKLPWKVDLGDGNAPSNQIKLVLDDKDNTEWAGTNKSDDITITLTIDPIKLTAADLDIKYPLIHTYTGSPITFEADIEVSIKGSNPKEVFTDGDEYKIVWVDNKDIGPGKFIVEGIGNYEMSIDCLFTIYNPEPDYFVLKPDAKMDFVEIYVDYSTWEMVYNPLNNSRTNQQADTYLANLYCWLSIPEILDMFASPKNRLKVWYADGTECQPGADEMYNYALLGTGMYITLHDSLGTELDRITAMISGDVDGDGDIGSYDIELLLRIISGDYEIVQYDANWEYIMNPYFIASITNRLYSYPDTYDIQAILEFVSGISDFNQDFYPW